MISSKNTLMQALYNDDMEAVRVELANGADDDELYMDVDQNDGAQYIKDNFSDIINLDEMTGTPKTDAKNSSETVS